MLFMEGSEKYSEAAQKMKKQLSSLAGEEIQTMDENTLKTIQAVFGFIDAAEVIIAEQQRALQTVNSKLDELLRIVESK